MTDPHVDCRVAHPEHVAMDIVDVHCRDCYERISEAERAAITALRRIGYFQQVSRELLFDYIERQGQ